MEIKSFSFNIDGAKELKLLHKGVNWPVVYMIHNDTDLYIGETTSASKRMEEHLKSQKKQHLKYVKVVFDDTYNKSVVLDLEQKLIKYCSVDGTFKNIVNANKGQSASHEYYNRHLYVDNFKSLWNKLISLNLAKTQLDTIENKNIFKFSPYSALTEEQNNICVDVINDLSDCISKGANGVSLINGCAGTGKTVLAISLINSIVNALNVNENELTEEELYSDKIQAVLNLKKILNPLKPLKIGFVFPMTGIRTIMKSTFGKLGNGLRSSMVIGPCDVKKEKYDILFVDEAHRLGKRKNKQNIGEFDKNCSFFGLDKMTANELDWVLRAAKYKVLFYDKDQSVRGSDVSNKEFNNSLNSYESNITYYNLNSQMRCLGGDSYIKYIKEIMNCTSKSIKDIINYEFELFDDVDIMINKIRALDEVEGLSKTLAGFSWKWKTYQGKKEIPDNLDVYNKLVVKGEYDIEIDGHKYIWNISRNNWINRLDSRYTIGCIHTTQGFDLNYVGVIFGKEIDYDPNTNSIVISLKDFEDVNAKKSTEISIVKEYIINAYTTMMARGIKGCYVYACNKNLKNYLKQFIRKGKINNE